MVSGSESAGLGRSYSGSPQETAQSQIQQRRERAAIAAQACETCRSRKSKCDEQRPKCGLCRRLNVDCKYREPQPTKKDKTMVYILDTMSRVEAKLDFIGRVVSPNSSAFEAASTLSSSQQLSPNTVASPQARDPLRSIRSSQVNPTSDSSYTYQHITTPHKVLLWPAIYMQLIPLQAHGLDDFNQLLQEGTPWFLRHELVKDDEVLSCNAGINSIPVVEGPHSSVSGTRVIFPDLTMDMMADYSRNYFNTFNMLWPILDREIFNREILRKVSRDGFAEGDSRSTMALLVFALGKLASEGVAGPPIDGHRSGIRGGSAKVPPALEIFNEARRRLGFIMTRTSVENIQCLLLAACYYEACARHPDFWRLMVSAAMACQVLLKCEPIEWDSHFGEVIKRVYWTCNLIENWYHIDLDLPRTGICDHEDNVPLPGGNAATVAAENQHILMHFAAIVSLRRLITRIHSAVFEATGSKAESPEDYDGPPVAVISELARQLESWRELLPLPLQWDDADRFAHPNTPLGMRRASGPLFTVKTLPSPLEQHIDSQVVTAQLRSRYYYAQFIIYRPFVFKALHFPEQMSNEDRHLAARCLQSGLLWPIAMSPCKDRKRLLPVLFAWTSNFLSILLIFRMITVSPMLDQIAREFLDPIEVEGTVMLLLEWIRDMAQVEGVARWSWSVLRELYHDVPGVLD